ncbi:MAG: 3-oxoacid CoA-transferase subunit A [Chloroflexi bacterium]|nr:3-oxoacid CoA-transferase subunit A [Chloroflexota bacterium]
MIVNQPTRGEICASLAEAVRDVQDSATIMVGGFAGVGTPVGLVKALVARGPKGLTVIANQMLGDKLNWEDGYQIITNRMAKKLIASFAVPRRPSMVNAVEQQFKEGTLEVELVPQGTLAERIRAGGAGLGGFLTPVGVGTLFATGKRTVRAQGKTYLLELPLKADFALVRASVADTKGNLIYHRVARNFNPLMAMAGRVTIAEVDRIVPYGELDPDTVMTPYIFVDRIVKTEGGS